jgi:hypothetical protein
MDAEPDLALCVAMTTAKGLAVRVELSTERLVSLRHQTTAALRIEPVVIQESDGMAILPRVGPRLCEEDLAQIDQATFDFAAQLLAQQRSQPVIVLPVSFFTLAARKGRTALAKVAGPDIGLLKSRVIVELVDVGRGTPISRLIDVGGLITTACRASFVRVQPGVDMLAAVRGYRPHGLTLDGADLPGGDAQIASQILTFGDQARGAAPMLVVQGLANDGFFQVAEVAGLTHAGLRAVAQGRQRSAA